MSRQNLETVQAAFDAYYRGDMERIQELADPELVVTQLAELPDPGTFHGRQGFVEVIDDWEESWEDLRIDVLRTRDVGDHVVTTVRQRARGRGSGVEVEGEFTFLFTLKAGRIVRWRMFTDEASALEVAYGYPNRDWPGSRIGPRPEPAQTAEDHGSQAHVRVRRGTARRATPQRRKSALGE